MYSNEDQNRFSFDSAGVPLAVPKNFKVSAGIDTFSVIMYHSLLYYSISRPNYEIKIKLLSIQALFWRHPAGPTACFKNFEMSGDKHSKLSCDSFLWLMLK